MTNEHLAAMLLLLVCDSNEYGYSRYTPTFQRWTQRGKFDVKCENGVWHFAPFPVNNWGPELTADEAHAQLVEVLNRDQ